MVNKYNNLQLQIDFPNCHVEPKMTRQSLTENAPYYMMRLLTGATITPHPKGIHGIVSINHYGRSYLLFEEDFDMIRQLMEDFCQSFIRRNGYAANRFSSLLNSNPGLVLDAMLHAKNKAKEIFFIDESKIKVFWIIPDAEACGYYRSQLPRVGMQAQSDTFFVEAGSYFSYTQLAYYDVLIYHRCPPPAILDVLQRLKTEGKVLVFDTDDDLFDIPEWNPCRPDWNTAAHQRATTSIEIADFCVVSTDHLKSRIEDKFPGKNVMVCPNLLDLKFYGSPITIPNKQINKVMVGYKPRKTHDGQVEFVKPSKRQTATSGGNRMDSLDLSQINFDKEYRPITICWFGSPTHDSDLIQLVEPIRELINRYGIGIRFVFFGSLPAEFATMEVSSGNLNATLNVNPEYRGLIEYVQPVEHRNFPVMLKNIKPDIGLCPLVDHDFNLSKSNIKVLEFATMSTPCVATDFGPYKFIRNGENGLKVSGDHQSWVNAIERLILDSEYRLMLGLAANKALVDNFSWQMPSDNTRLWQASFDKMISLTRISRASRRDAVMPYLNEGKLENGKEANETVQLNIES